MDSITGWVDHRINGFAHRLGVHIADRIVERTGLDNIADHLGAFLLGVNGVIGDLVLLRDD